MTSFGTLEILSIVLFALVVAVLSALATSLVWRWLIRNDRVKYKSKDDIDRIENQKRHISNLRDIKRMVNTIDLVCDILHDEHTVLQDTYSYLKLMMKPGYNFSEHELDYLRQETNRKSKMLQKMISFSIETLQYERQMDVPREDFIAINQFCEDIFVTCERYLKNDKIDLSIETPLSDAYTVCTNMNYLHKLIKHLLICSMDYTTEGFIKLKLDEDKKHNRLCFVLSDTGPGIPKDIVNHVFDKLPNDSNIKNRITCVRLRICYAIVHLLGGYIYVDQNYTNGTSIVFAIKK